MVGAGHTTYRAVALLRAPGGCRVAKKRKQGRIDVEVFPSCFHFFKQPALDEGLEVNRCGLSLGNAGIHEVADPAIRIDENDFSQFTRIDFREFAADAFRGLVQQIPDGVNLFRRPVRCLTDSVQHVEDPLLPGALRRDRQKPVIIGPLVADDVSTEVKDGNVQQALVDQVEQIENPAGATIAINERMDRLELVVHHGQADQRIDIVCFMDIALPVGQLVPEQLLSLW